MIRTGVYHFFPISCATSPWCQRVRSKSISGVSFFPHYLCNLLSVAEVQVEIDKHQGVSFLPHYL